MSPPLDLQSISATPAVAQIEAVNDATAAQARDSRGKAPAPKVEKTKEASAAQAPPSDDGQTSLSFSIDRSTHDIKIRVANESSGKVVREFELKGLGEVHQEPRNKGVMVDDKT